MSGTVRSAVADLAVKTVVRLAAVQMAPAATAIPHLRAAAWPRLAGIGDRHHVALTFDDGPDHSTSAFLDLLEQYGAVATFFLLGRHVQAHSCIVRRLHEAGHEIAVHGWDHRCLALRRPGTLRADLRRTVELVEDLTGCRPRRYRPPYGVLTTEGVVAAAATGLQPVLWSASGRDWSRRTDPDRIAARVERGRTWGGTVLLHDSDRIGRGGSWRDTLAATGLLLERWSAEGLRVGSLAEHWDRPGERPGGRPGARAR